MKRSEMVKQLMELTSGFFDNKISQELCIRRILGKQEELGMQTPGVPAKIIKSSKHRFGSGCTMHCICGDCDPAYLMHVWEHEND